MVGLASVHLPSLVIFALFALCVVRRNDDPDSFRDKRLGFRAQVDEEIVGNAK